MTAKFTTSPPFVIRNLEKLGIDCLVAIGGDDTLSFASALSKAGFPVVAVPKTMDNDVQSTEYCLGFSTAVTRWRADAITRQRTTCVGSHERIRHFPYLWPRRRLHRALHRIRHGYSLPDSRISLSIWPASGDLLIDGQEKQFLQLRACGRFRRLHRFWKEGEVKEYGEADAYGHRKKADVGQILGEEIRKRTGQEIITSDLTYDLRAGEPDAIDQIAGIGFANIALDLIRDGVSGRMTAIEGGRYAHVPIPEAALGPRKVDIASMYNIERYRPSYSIEARPTAALQRLPEISARSSRGSRTVGDRGPTKFLHVRTN